MEDKTTNATEPKQRVYFKSDFAPVLRLFDKSGAAIGVPCFDWEALFRTPCGYTRPYKASCRGGVMTNCHEKAGELIITFDRHGLGPGELTCEFHSLLPDGSYADGNQEVVYAAPMDIELTIDPCDTPCGLEAEIALPEYIRDFDRLESTYGDTLDGINNALRAILGREPFPPEADRKLRQTAVVRCSLGYITNNSEPGVVYRNKGFMGIVFSRIGKSVDGMAMRWRGIWDRSDKVLKSIPHLVGTAKAHEIDGDKLIVRNLFKPWIDYQPEHMSKRQVLFVDYNTFGAAPNYLTMVGIEPEAAEELTYMHIVPTERPSIRVPDSSSFNDISDVSDLLSMLGICHNFGWDIMVMPPPLEIQRYRRRRYVISGKGPIKCVAHYWRLFFSSIDKRHKIDFRPSYRNRRLKQGWYRIRRRSLKGAYSPWLYFRVKRDEIDPSVKKVRFREWV